MKSTAYRLLKSLSSDTWSRNLILGRLFGKDNIKQFDKNPSVQIHQTTDPITKRSITVMSTDAFSYQSAIFDDNQQEFYLDYPKFFHLIRHIVPDFQKVLMVGGGGYTFPVNFLSVYPGKQIDVVEINSQATAFAQQFFHLKQHTDLQIFHQSGQQFLAECPPETYDAVIIDAFEAYGIIPDSLISSESFQNVFKCLKPQGAMLLNMITSPEADLSDEFKTVMTNIRNHFSITAAFKVRMNPNSEDDRNMILTAVKGDTDITEQSQDTIIQKLLKHRIC